MNAKAQIVIGFTMLLIAALVGLWFARTYHRIGPESLEPVVLVGGIVMLIAMGAFAFLQLVIGIKRLE